MAARLVYSSFIGASAFDEATNIAIDWSGHVYVVGRTYSDDLPTTAGAFDRTPGGSGDAFVAKLSRDGSSLEYATYLGGSGEDWGHGIAVDRRGRAYVVGTTYSGDFPTTTGRAHGGHNDVFVARLSPDGRRLDHSTLVGGVSLDVGYAIAVDAAGQAHVTGYTYSADFPTTPGAFDTRFNGGEAFVAKLRPDGSTLAYSTFLGGDPQGPITDDEVGRAIAVGPNGRAYVTGYTRSLDFPTTPGAFDTTPSGGDVFVTQMSRDGSALVYSTVLASGDGTDLVVDRAGRAHLVGFAGPAFPTTSGAFDREFDEFYGDSFVAEIGRDGSRLVYGSYLGGSGPDSAISIALGADGYTYVSGFTYSVDFPTTPDAVRPQPVGMDGFLVRLTRDRSGLSYGTLLGGNGDDLAFGLAVDRRGTAYVAGQTRSSDFHTTPGAAQTVHGGDADAFVTALHIPAHHHR